MTFLLTTTLRWLTLPFALWFAWGARRWLIAPRFRYVSHRRLKSGDVFLTVKRVRWYPPWTEYEETWHWIKDGAWSREHDGMWAGKNEFIDEAWSLRAILSAAEARERETDELLSPERRAN